MTVQSQPATFKITYATLGANMDEFHQAFGEALDRVSGAWGKTHGVRIAGREIQTAETFADRSPIDRSIVLGHFAKADEKLVCEAIVAARKAWPAWRDLPWRDRLVIIRRAAEIISRDKFDLAATMVVEVGKNRLEAMGDVEESADLLRYYAQQMEDANGFVKPLASLSPNEHTGDVLRPFGVFAVIAPFNFPLALAAGMSAGALVAGNTVILKPASDAPLMSCLLERVMHEAGIPEGVFNLITGSGKVFGDTILASRDVDGIIFTGSKEVGMGLYHDFSRRHPRPCILELGGKNPTIVMESADLEMAAEGLMRSSFGYGGQKCSACSRAYVHRDVYERFMELLMARTKTIVMGDPRRPDVYLGPVVSQEVVDRYEQWIDRVRHDGGRVLIGGNVLTNGDFANGYYVEPAIVDGLSQDHPIFETEIFAPLLAMAPVDSLDQALALCNRVEYGLTAGIFSEKAAELDLFFNEIEAGVLYSNRRTGATTGAWPGVQSFCGWKGSGSSGKGGCGPYYVAQFMREQSRTRMS